MMSLWVSADQPGRCRQRRSSGTCPIRNPARRRMMRHGPCGRRPPGFAQPRPRSAKVVHFRTDPVFAYGGQVSWRRRSAGGCVPVAVPSPTKTTCRPAACGTGCARLQVPQPADGMPVRERDPGPWVRTPVPRRNRDLRQPERCDGRPTKNPDRRRRLRP
jgi:hypothetical protein